MQELDAWSQVKNQSNNVVAEYTYSGLGFKAGGRCDVDGHGTVETNASSPSADPWFQFVDDSRRGGTDAVPPTSALRGRCLRRR
ncbi:MAG: hypothetical protein IPJ41_12790 [Phycisphaerales bacterium]|nr:hypothetical protein [Phycisphaerales bacterium]